MRRAVGRVTWRGVRVTFAVAVAVAVWHVLEANIGGPETNPEVRLWEEFLPIAIFDALTAFFIALCTVAADERAARRARRWPAYLVAVAIGSAVGALAQSCAYQWLQWPSNIDHSMQSRFFEYLIWGSIIVFVYANQRSALLAAARASAAQIRRAEAQRQTFESRLQALQARVEPQFLFSTLAQVRDLYEIAPGQGSEMLGNLIVYLRAALPHLRRSTSALGQEMDLAIAYFNIMRPRLGAGVLFDVDVPRAARATPLPPMLLLPLLEHVLVQRLASCAGPGNIRLSARFAGGKLRLEIANRGHAFDPAGGRAALRIIEERLQALYDGDATLILEPSGLEGTITAMEVPHGWTDGDSR